MEKISPKTIVKHKSLDGKYIVVANKDTPYDGKNSSPFNSSIEVSDGYDYKICKVNEDGSFSVFIDVLAAEILVVSKP